MTADELWQAFCRSRKVNIHTDHEAWAFGGAPDYLAALVMQGIKTATASGYDLYFIDGEEEPLPQPGEYSIILDSGEQAVAVIQTVRTEVIPFDQVGPEQAYKEGEGDRSLSYWRKVHEEFFTEDFAASGLTFRSDSRILCEEFQLLASVYEVAPFTEADAMDMCSWQYPDEYAVYNCPAWEDSVKKGLSYTKADLRSSEYYKVLKEGQFLGFFRIRDLGDALCLGLGIRPELCGRGNGDMLISLALAKISEEHPGKRITLSVRADNNRAVRVYKKAGFQTIREYTEDSAPAPGRMLGMEAFSR